MAATWVPCASFSQKVWRQAVALVLGLLKQHFKRAIKQLMLLTVLWNQGYSGSHSGIALSALTL